MSPTGFFSPEAFGAPDPDETTFFGGYRPPSAQDDAPEQLAAAITPEQRQAILETALQNPNVQAFLNTVAHTEGATYDSLPDDLPGAPKKFTDYSQFPLDGPGRTSSGRYQILRPTYDYLSSKLGLTDFSPRTQDLMALQLLNENGALQPLMKGDLDAVLPVASRFWASLPQDATHGTRYPPQRYTPYDQVWSIFDLNRSP